MSLALLFAPSGPILPPPPITWPTDATLAPRTLAAALAVHTAGAPLNRHAATAALTANTATAEILHG